MSFIEAHKQFDEYLQQSSGLTPLLNPTTAWAKVMMAPFASLLEADLSRESTDIEAQPRAAEAEHDLRAQVEKLQQQVAELQKKPQSHKKKRTKK